MTTMTLTTPAEIDTEIARIQSEAARAEQVVTEGLATLDRIASVQGTYEADYPWNSYEKQEEASAAVRAAEAKIARLHAEVAPLHAEFAARRWTRYYLVTNTGGHVHWTTGCDTCFPTTAFAWLTEYSGMSHEEFVTLAGEKACTICFPDAPVAVLASRTRIEAPEAKARREEREAKAAAKAASEIVVEGLRGWTNQGGGKHVYKTTRAATNAIAENLRSLCGWGTDHPTSPEWVANIEIVRAALAAKGIDYDYDKALANVRKRVARDGVEPKF